MDEDLKDKPDSYWKEKLTPEQYNIMRKKGTEAPFTGVFYANTDDGMYHCAGCGQALFSSETKYDAGCGWPSFYESIESEAIEMHEDTSFGMVRTEVRCNKCGAHLGHIFDDGPEPTGKRYCINSAALHFDKKEAE